MCVIVFDFNILYNVLKYQLQSVVEIYVHQFEQDILF